MHIYKQHLRGGTRQGPAQLGGMQSTNTGIGGAFETRQKRGIWGLYLSFKCRVLSAQPHICAN